MSCIEDLWYQIAVHLSIQNIAHWCHVNDEERNVKHWIKRNGIRRFLQICLTRENEREHTIFYFSKKLAQVIKNGRGYNHSIAVWLGMERRKRTSQSRWMKTRNQGTEKHKREPRAPDSTTVARAATAQPNQQNWRGKGLEHIMSHHYRLLSSSFAADLISTYHFGLFGRLGR